MDRMQWSPLYGKLASEIDGNRVMVTVAKKDIERISIRHGIQSPNPTLQIILSLALASVAYFPLRELIDWFRHGGTLFTHVDYLIPLPVIGAWTNAGARPRPFSGRCI